MAISSFDDVLKQARALPVREQQRLVDELTHPIATENGTSQLSLYDVLKARGIIGCLKDAPSDLSTNPYHL